MSRCSIRSELAETHKEQIMKPTIVMSSLLSIALLTISSSGYPQSLEGPGENDPGVDVAVVIATKANLRDAPGISSGVLREVNRGEMLALVNRAPVGPWYNVIHIKSSIEGWVNGNTIRIKYTERKKAGPVFEEGKPAQVMTLQSKSRTIRIVSCT
jgi:uncharacterized protein YgiM (DUF1202 family)